MIKFEDRMTRCNRIAKAFGWKGIYIAAEVIDGKVKWLASTIVHKGDLALQVEYAAAEPEAAIDALEDKMLTVHERQFVRYEPGSLAAHAERVVEYDPDNPHGEDPSH